MVNVSNSSVLRQLEKAIIFLQTEFRRAQNTGCNLCAQTGIILWITADFFPETAVNILKLFPGNVFRFFVRHHRDLVARHTVLQDIAELFPAVKGVRVSLNLMFTAELIRLLIENIEAFRMILDNRRNELSKTLLRAVDHGLQRTVDIAADNEFLERTVFLDNVTVNVSEPAFALCTLGKTLRQFVLQLNFTVYPVMDRA